jgi:catechol 2,3-dioxygenase-like lactoylglutathione lyase family enzyme
MLNNSKAICFVATKNPVDARKFYEKTLGLALISDDPFAIVFDANGTMLRVQKVEDFVPAQHTVLGWKVANLRSEIKELMSRGVRFERFEGMQQDDLGIWTSPAGGRVAWFKDVDGNTLSLTQLK